MILSAFCISFITVGFTNAFGVFQQYYIGLLHKDASAISWLGSLNTFFLFGGSLFVGVLINKVHPRVSIDHHKSKLVQDRTDVCFYQIIVAIGSIFLLIGVFLASICTQYWQLILTQGLLMGIGDSLLFTPALICVTVAFQKRRGLALGMTVAGSSVGGIVWPVALSRLLKQFGFGWTFRIAGFIMMPLCLVSILSISMPGQARRAANGTPRLPPPKPDLGSIIKNRRYQFFVLGGWFLYIGLFAGLSYIAVYGVSQGLSEDTAFYLVTITNAASLFGRVIPGALADIYGPYNLMILAGTSSGIIMTCLTAAKSNAGIIGFAIAYGFASGSVISLLGACVAPLLPSPAQYGPALGIMMAFLSTA